MKIKDVIQFLEKENDIHQLADMEIQIIDPNGYAFKLENVRVHSHENVVSFHIDEGSCD